MPELNIEEARSRVYGIEAAIAERAVFLLDKLARSVLHPYVLYSTTTDLAQNDQTDLSVVDFRFDAGGPFVITHVRVNTDSDNTPLASAATAPFSNVSLQLLDMDGQHNLTKDPVLLPVLVGISDNTWTLDRPYVLERRSALLVQATEMNVDGTTNLFVGVHGTVVLGDMTAREVEEAIALGIFPMGGVQPGVWDPSVLLGGLFGMQPPRLKGEAADTLDALRGKVALLRAKLRSAEYTSYHLTGNSNNITRNAVTLMSRESFRQDQSGPFAVTRVRAMTAATLGASAATGIFTNVSFSFYSVDEQLSLTKLPVQAPILFSRANNTWTFPHPHVMGKNGSMQITLTELDTNGTTDVYVALVGEAVRGVDHNDLRAAIALGLYPLVSRPRS